MTTDRILLTIMVNALNYFKELLTLESLLKYVYHTGEHNPNFSKTPGFSKGQVISAFWCQNEQNVVLALAAIGLILFRELQTQPLIPWLHIRVLSIVPR